MFFASLASLIPVTKHKLFSTCCSSMCGHILACPLHASNPSGLLVRLGTQMLAVMLAHFLSGLYIQYTILCYLHLLLQQCAECCSCVMIMPTNIVSFSMLKSPNVLLLLENDTVYYPGNRFLHFV